MDLAYNTAPASNRERHAGISAAWQLAQSSPHTLTAYTRNLTGFCVRLDSHNLDLLTVRRVHVDGFRHKLSGAPTTVARTLAVYCGAKSAHDPALRQIAAQAREVGRLRRRTGAGLKRVLLAASQETHRLF